jgi:hypothetical protein
MKKIYLILFSLSILGLFSCVKQKHCDCESEGIFTYNADTKGGTFSIDPILYLVEGPIPKKFRLQTPIKVRVCLYRKSSLQIYPSIFGLTCIEEIK